MPLFFRAGVLKIYKESTTVAASEQQALLEGSLVQFQTFTPACSCPSLWFEVLGFFSCYE